MSAVIRQMVLRKRAAKAEAAANAAAYADVVARAKGEPGMVWRGAYKADANYVIGDAVSRKGSSYIATSDAPGAPPGKGWDVLAEKGKDGAAGKAKAPSLIQLGGGGVSDLYTLPQYDPTIQPAAITILQDGVWVQISWLEFLSLIGSTPTVLPNQIVVNGIGITVGGQPVFVTPDIIDDQVLVNGVGITVGGQPVIVTSGLVSGQIMVKGQGVTVEGDPVTVGGSSAQLVFSNGQQVLVNNQPIEVTI